VSSWATIRRASNGSVGSTRRSVSGEAVVAVGVGFVAILPELVVRRVRVVALALDEPTQSRDRTQQHHQLLQYVRGLHGFLSDWCGAHGLNSSSLSDHVTEDRILDVTRMYGCPLNFHSTWRAPAPIR
jgi:hypothetical protein